MALHSALAQKGSDPHRGRTLFTRRSVRRIFRHVQEVNCPGGARETTLGCAAAKNDPASFRHSRRKPGRGPGPFLEFPEDGGRGTEAPIPLPFPTDGPYYPPGRQAASAANSAPRWLMKLPSPPVGHDDSACRPPSQRPPQSGRPPRPPLAGRPAPRLAGPRKNRPPAVGGRAVFPYHSCAFGRFQRKWAERQRSSTTVTSPATMAAALPAISQSPAQTRAPARDAQA